MAKMLKRISDEEIEMIAGMSQDLIIRTIPIGALIQFSGYVVQAQLESCQKEHDAVVREMIKEIKERFFTLDGDDNLILGSALPRDRIVTWWQAFEKEYGVE